MTARVSAVLEIEVTAARPLSPSIATATPPMAVISGIPAASSEPSVTVRTTRAMIRPMMSLLPVLGALADRAAPPALTASVLLFAALLRFVSAVTELFCRSPEVTRYSTVAMPVSPSGVTCCDAWGEMTAATCGALAAWASVRSMSAALAGLASVVPSVAWKTSCALVPAAAGKSCCTWSSAVCDWEPGMVNVLSSVPPDTFAPAAPATSTSSHSATTSHRCAKHQRAIACKTLDIGQSLPLDGGTRVVVPRRAHARAFICQH